MKQTSKIQVPLPSLSDEEQKRIQALCKRFGLEEEELINAAIKAGLPAIEARFDASTPNQD